MALLSRVAEHLFWLGRHVERAENTARLLDVTFHGRLEPGLHGVAGAKNTWEALVATLGLEEPFRERYAVADEPSVIAFLTVDLANPSSIVAALSAARENARSVRDQISSETWVAINRLYHATSRRNLDLIMADGLYEFCDEVRLGAQTFHGTAQSTSLHDEGWRWLQAGVQIERGDMVTRIVDSKYHLLFESVHEVGGTFDRYQWMALLRSVSGYEAFRRTHQPGFELRAIIEFLVLSPEFPRSLRACADRLQEELEEATRGADRRQRNPVLRAVSELQNRLEFETADSLVAGGLHDFLEGAQESLAAITSLVSEAFFWSEGTAV